MNKKPTLLITLMLSFLFVINLVSCNKKDASTDSAGAVLEHGSAGKLQGKTVIISCFASDKNTSWNSEAQKKKTLKNLKIATEWIEEQGKNYNKDLEFVYDWSKYPDLCCETTFSEDMVNMPENGDYVAYEYIDRAVPPIDELKKKYSAQNVVYIMFFNTPSENKISSCTRHYYKGLEYPYEICFIYTKYDNYDEPPATYAHEILHVFGAPDLYTSENPDNNRNINRAFVNFVKNNFPNEIMYTTLDIQTNIQSNDSITNEISKITAYYIGWEEKCEYVEEFGIGKSEYEKSED